MLSCVDQLADEHFVERGFLAHIVQPDHTPPNLTLAGPCFRGSAMPEPVEERAPLIGEHTRQICIDDLGMGTDEIDALFAEDVLETTEPTP